MAGVFSLGSDQPNSAFLNLSIRADDGKAFRYSITRASSLPISSRPSERQRTRGSKRADPRRTWSNDERLTARVCSQQAPVRWRSVNQHVCLRHQWRAIAIVKAYTGIGTLAGPVESWQPMHFSFLASFSDWPCMRQQ